MTRADVHRAAARFALMFCLSACNRPVLPPLRVVTAGGAGPPTVVLLHGFSSRPELWRAFTGTIAVKDRKPRFLFPEGPFQTVPPLGPSDGRAWWPLALASYKSGPKALPDLSRDAPPGLVSAAHRVTRMLWTVDPTWYRRTGPLILGGFSQGAMVATEVALDSNVNLSALVLLSGTAVNESVWREKFRTRAGLPVFVAHGRADAVLPFVIAERLVHEMKEAGLDVTWFPFDGGHEITAEVVAELNRFLETVLR